MEKDILKEIIHIEIEKKGKMKPLCPFSEIPIDYTGGVLSKIRKNGQLVWKGKVGGGLKGILKRVLRRGMIFFVVPIVKQQNVYNFQLLQTIRQLNKQAVSQREEIESLKRQIGKNK